MGDDVDELGVTRLQCSLIFRRNGFVYVWRQWTGNPQQRQQFVAGSRKNRVVL